MYVCVCMYIRIYVCIYVCMYMCIYCMYVVFMYVCMYVWTSFKMSSCGECMSLSRASREPTHFPPPRTGKWWMDWPHRTWDGLPLLSSPVCKAYVCMYEWMYIYMYVCIEVYRRVAGDWKLGLDSVLTSRISEWIYIYIYVSMYVYVYICICVYIHIYKYVCMEDGFINKCTIILLSRDILLYIHTYIHTYLHT